MNKRALILGISGQDGSYLTDLLLRKGYEVHGTSRDDQGQRLAGLEHLGVRDRVQTYSLSIADFRDVFRVINEVKPDEIYNLAGQTSVGMSFRNPAETFESVAVGTLNVLECVRLLERPVKVFLAGSSECFGNTPVPAKEDTPFLPLNPYAVAKAAAFWSGVNYRENYGVYVCTGILFNHESPLRPLRFVTRKIASSAVRIAQGSSERLKLGNTAIQRDWGWAPEYVEAMWLMLQQEKPEDFVIATGQASSLQDFIAAVFTAVGLDWRDHVDVDPTLFRPSDSEISVGDPAKAKRVLGWEAKAKVREVAAALVEHERHSHQPV